MRKLLQLLSPTDEFIIVVVAAFGPSIVASILIVIQAGNAGAQIREADLVFLLTFEPFVLLILGYFLYVRGWTLERIGLGPNLKETLFGVGLFAVIELVTYVLWLVAVLGVPQLQEIDEAYKPVAGRLSPPWSTPSSRKRSYAATW